MTADRHEFIRDLLDQLAKADGALRDPLLIESCGGDQDLEREVRALLPFFLRVQQDELPPPFEHVDLAAADLFGGGATTLTRGAEETFPEPPFEIGMYRATEVIGAGGMGVVYHAVLRPYGTPFALKLLRKAYLDSEDRRRFALEVGILRQLRHPAIAWIVDADVAAIHRLDVVQESLDFRPFLVMELVTGTQLIQYADAARLDTPGRLALLARVCDGVEFAHHRGIIHRDLKPPNVLVDESGCPKILDFGIARVASLALDARDEKPGRFIGTPAYASPEQLAGQPDELSPAIDVFALGRIACELITGKLPPRDATIELSWNLLRDEVQLRQNPDAAEPFRAGLEALLRRALSPTPAQRFATAGALAAALEALLARTRPEISPPFWTRVRRRLAALLQRSTPANTEASQRALGAVLRTRIAMAADTEEFRTHRGREDTSGSREKT